MHQSFVSYKKGESSREKDKTINVGVFLRAEGSEIEIEFDKTTKTQKPGGGFRTTLEESINLRDVSADDLGKITSLISNWLGSRSQATISESLEDISGIYKKSPTSSGLRSKPQEVRIEFSNSEIVLGTGGLGIIIPQEEDQILFNIPATEVPGKSPDYANIFGLRDLLYDFFDLEFEGKAENVGFDLPPEIQSSERLDKELQRRVVTEFESKHFQSSVRTAFTVLEERVRELGEYSETEYGTGLIQKAFHPDEGKLVFGETNGEREGVMFLYRGAFQALRNPASHRFIESVDEDYARDAIYTVNLLLRLLHENYNVNSDQSQN